MHNVTRARARTLERANLKFNLTYSEYIESINHFITLFTLRLIAFILSCARVAQRTGFAAPPSTSLLPPSNPFPLLVISSTGTIATICQSKYSCKYALGIYGDGLGERRTTCFERSLVKRHDHRRHEGTPTYTSSINGPFSARPSGLSFIYFTTGTVTLTVAHGRIEYTGSRWDEKAYSKLLFVSRLPLFLL